MESTSKFAVHGVAGSPFTLKTAPSGRSGLSKPEQKLASLGHSPLPAGGPLESPGSEDEGAGPSVVVSNVAVSLGTVSFGAVDVEFDVPVVLGAPVGPVGMGPDVPLAPLGPVGRLVDVDPAGLVGSPTGGFTEGVGPTGPVGDVGPTSVV